MPKIVDRIAAERSSELAAMMQMVKNDHELVRYVNQGMLVLIV